MSTINLTDDLARAVAELFGAPTQTPPPEEAVVEAPVTTVQTAREEVRQSPREEDQPRRQWRGRGRFRRSEPWAPLPTVTTVTVADTHVELRFPRKPSPVVLGMLHSAKWQFSAGVWRKLRSTENIAFAESIKSMMGQ